VLERVLPPVVAVAEAYQDVAGTTLFPEEEAAVARAVPKRRTEFATARACARTALAQLGQPPVPILPGPRGAPRWPAGVTGSITHCDGYRAAGVAWTTDLAAIGLDAEPNQALPDGVLDLIAFGPERAQLARLAQTEPADVCWDRLLFCAKEAVYKVWFPLTQRWLGFEEAEVVIKPHDGAFTARLLVPGPLVAGSPLTVLNGRWIADRGLVATAITVPG